MTENKVDPVEKSVAKRSLLEKYDIPVENLSYEYITQCKNVKELERIVQILRSGEEGFYPDLTEHAEKRLGSVNPESTVLKIAKPVLTKDMLEPEKRIKLENDISEWMSEMKLREKDLEEGRAMQINEPIPQPDVREIKFDESKKKKQASQNKETHKRIGACDYAGWDKYDADTELNRIDLRHEQKQAETKREQKKLCAKEEKMNKASREDIINKLTLTGTELSMMAEKEREKGNEAFKAGDYGEALQFYNSSIAIDATINAYNNRAITYIKLQRYNDALNDCNSVISMDYTNIKGLLRRGLALEHLEKKAQALVDYEAVLKLDPLNKVAITALNKLREPCDSRKIRMKIEEASATDNNAKSSHVKYNNENKKSKNISHEHEAPLLNSSKNVSSSKTSSNTPSTLINPIPIEGITSRIHPQVCFCNNAPSSSQYSSPQPHIRDIYCPKVSQNSAKFPKPQSIFTDTKIPTVKSSGIIIEDIPNEPCEISKKKYNPEQNNNKRDNVRMSKKSGVIIEEITEDKPNDKVEVNNVKKTSKTPKTPIDFSKPRTNLIGTLNSSTNPTGVIIEEISNEPSVKPEVKFNVAKTKKSMKLKNIKTMSNNLASGDNGEINEKSQIIIEEFPIQQYVKKIERKSDSKANDDCSKNMKKSSIVPTPQSMCESKVSSVKSSTTNVKEEPNELSQKPKETSNSDKNKHEAMKHGKSIMFDSAIDKNDKIIENVVVDKVTEGKHSSKVDSKQEMKIDPIKSPYEFLHRWHSLRNDRDLHLHAKLLKALPPENIDTVIGNKLDGEMLSTILRCFEQHSSGLEDAKQVLHFLQCLGKTKRFSIARMFMNERDKKVLQNVLLFLEVQGFPENIPNLRNIYDVSM